MSDDCFLTMGSHPPIASLNRPESVIDDLPDEVLEYILSLVPPYKDLQECSLVCKRWNKATKSVIRHTQKNLNRALSEFVITWEEVTPADLIPSITKRYSHSSCRYENSMYVFGGCTSTSTTFNDLWQLDLNRREWIRPLAMGSYPSPKACATIVCHEDKLILFGGWTHPSPYPLHQGWRLFNELHVYNIQYNSWAYVTTATLPPAMAGHSASVIRNTMVVFGGLQKTNSLGQYMSSSDVWCFDIVNLTWVKQATTEIKPHARYGQSQLTLDDEHILILGGCGGPNMVFSDVWLLSTTEPVWKWQEIPVKNPQWAASHMWCHPACKVGEQVVVFSRNPISNAPAMAYSSRWNVPNRARTNDPNLPPPPGEWDAISQDVMRRVSARQSEQRSMESDQNVNGRRGTLGQRPSNQAASPSSSSGEESEPENTAHRRVMVSSRPIVDQAPHHSKPPYNMDCSDPGVVSMAAFRDNPPSSVTRHKDARIRQRQLESLKRMEERIKNLSRGCNPPSTSSPQKTRNEQMEGQKISALKNCMAMFVLDITHVLSEDCYVMWLAPKESHLPCGAPEEMILYTLVAGKGELIMFGGIQKDATSIANQAQQSSHASNTVSNSLHFISAPRGII